VDVLDTDRPYIGSGDRLSATAFPPPPRDEDECEEILRGDISDRPLLPLVEVVDAVAATAAAEDNALLAAALGSDLSDGTLSLLLLVPANSSFIVILCYKSFVYIICYSSRRTNK
jgi:hypothetical protein